MLVYDGAICYMYGLFLVCQYYLPQNTEAIANRCLVIGTESIRRGIFPMIAMVHRGEGWGKGVLNYGNNVEDSTLRSGSKINIQFLIN